MDSIATFATTVTSADSCTHQFLGLLPWYHYLQVTFDPITKSCVVNNFQLLGSNGTQSGILLILLAVVDDLLRIAGLVAVFFVIYAGIKYITSQGSPDQTAQAQSTLINALIGLTIAVVAIGLISYIGGQLGGGPAPPNNAAGGNLDLSSLPNPTGGANGGIIQTALTIVFGLVGALSLLFVVIGGFRYVISQGDPQNVGRAKNTIIYALVGMLVAIVAESIVSLVVGRIQ